MPKETRVLASDTGNVIRDRQTRRQCLQTLFWATQAVGALTCAAHAADPYPTRPIRMIVPFVPGGGTDTTARIFAQFMSERLGQQVVVENQGGAAGIVGTTTAVRAAADGYTILFSPQSPIAIAQFMKPPPSYDAAKDLKPLAAVSTAPALLLAHPATPGKDLGAFIAEAKRSPGTYLFGSPGVGNEFHLMVELIKKQAAIDIRHIPYRGTAPAVTALLSNQIHLLVAALANGLEFVKDGKLRALAAFSEKRIPQLPDVPTISEIGFPQANMVPWFGVFAPAQAPQNVVDRWVNEVRSLQRSSEWRDKLAALGYEADARDTTQFEALIADSRKRWSDLVPSLDISSN